jgi:dihydroorotate dehydrogenase electron transfer subunit
MAERLKISIIKKKHESASLFGKTIHRLRMVRIRNIKKETPLVKTVTFIDEKCSEAQPGQFVMVWVPGVDEVPMSIASAEKKTNTITIAVNKKGEATAALHNLRKGSLLGIRGPYGKSFKIKSGKIIIIGGGTGIAPLYFLIQRLKKVKSKLTVIIGAKTKNELLFLRKINLILNADDKLIITTDDGTYGLKGSASEVLNEVLKKERHDWAYTCGPELMMKKVLEATMKHKIPLQASLERYMKCGVGLCGSCMIGEHRVCHDGPVFDGEVLSGIQEFGVSRRDASGRILPV